MPRQDRKAVLGSLHALVVLLVLFALPRLVHAQSTSSGTVTPLCVTGCGTGGVAFLVTSTSGQVGRLRNSGAFSETFVVRNNGTAGSGGATLRCSSVGAVTCGTVSPTNASLGVGDSVLVHVNYTVGALTTATLSLTITDDEVGAVASGSLSVVEALPPTVSLAPYASDVRDLSKCVASCFNLIYGYATPAYYTYDTPRRFAVVYNSGTARPTPVVQLDVTSNGPTGITNYVVQLRRISTNTLLTLLNGQTTVYFTALAATTRISVALDARTNGLATGAYDVQIEITGNLTSGGVTSTTTQTRLLVVDRSQSVFGVGFWPADVQQVYGGGSNQPAVVVEGDGSAYYYNFLCCSNVSFTTPTGAVGTLTKNATAGWFRRTYLDGSYIEFSYATGRMTKRVDRFGNTTQYIWSGAQLQQIVDPKGKAITLTYNASGYLATARDFTGRTSAWTMQGGTNRVSGIADPAGGAYSLGYTGDLLTSTTSRGGAFTTSFVYDSVRRLQSSQAPSIALFDGTAGRPTTTSAAAECIVWQPAVGGTTAASAKAGLRPDTVRAALTDAVGATTRFALDGFGAPTSVTDALAQTTTIARDAASHPTLVVTPRGQQMQSTYSGDLVTQVKNVTTGKTINYAYNSTGDPTRVSGDVVLTTYWYYDGTNCCASGGPKGALGAVFVGDTTAATVQYLVDSIGRVTSQTDKASHQTRIYYEATWGNRLKTVDPVGKSSAELQYDSLGRVASVTQPQSGTWTYTLDALNNSISTRDPLGDTTHTYYNPELTPARIVDPKGQVYKYEYNAAGLPVAIHDLGDTLRIDSVRYDLGGRARAMRSRKGDVINLSYDVVGRLLSRSATGMNTDTYRYAPDGRWTVAQNAASYDSLVYDVNGRLTQDYQTLAGATFKQTYGYDIRDRVLSRQLYRGAQLVVSGTYGYNGLTGQLDTLCILACMAVDRASDMVPSIIEYNQNTPANLWTERLTTDGDHAVGAREWWNGTTGQFADQLDPLFAAATTYDSVGRVLAQMPTYGSRPTRRFAYDAVGQLVTACDSSSAGCLNEYGAYTMSATYAYDRAGNRQEAAAGAMIVVGNRYTAFRGYSLAYDLNGNLISKSKAGDSLAFAWDPAGRLVQATRNGTQVTTFAYDALGRRVTKGSEHYVYDRGQLFAATDASGFITALYDYRPEGTPLSVHEGSIDGIALLDPINQTVIGIADRASGKPLKNYNVLSPWGLAQADSGTLVRFRFASQELDQETGLYHMGARYYDPALGRFISEDPLGIAGGMNLYVYAHNNPINLSDPTGMSPGPCRPQCPPVTVYGDPDPDQWGDAWIGGYTGNPEGVGACLIYGGPPELGDPPLCTDRIRDNDPPPERLSGAGGESCRADAAVFAVNAAIDLWGGRELWGVGKAVVGATLEQFAAGALQRAVAGRPFLRYATAVALGKAEERASAAAVDAVVETAQYGATLPRDVTLAKGSEGALKGVWASLSWKDFVPGYGSFKSGSELIRCLKGN